MTEEARKLADELEKVSGFGLTGWVRQYLTLEDRKLIVTALRSQPGTLAREEVAKAAGKIVWQSFAHLGGSFEGSKGTIAYDQCMSVGRAILALAPSHEATREALEFELKAAHNELEIADGEIERLKSLISKPVNKSMTNSGWGKEWPEADAAKEDWVTHTSDETPYILGLDLGSNDKTVAALIKDGQIEKVYNNLSPTHDPYTNPKAIIYYQCKCGAILDCNTKSFAALNNHASAKGWKIRWNTNGQGYQPFCVECGKDVE